MPTLSRSPIRRSTICLGALAWACLCGRALAQTPAEAPTTITPPSVKTQVAPQYPGGTNDIGAVILTVTVNSDGSVGEVEVFQSAGEAFDRAAIAAIQQWTFESAKRGEQPIASRVHVSFRFGPPPLTATQPMPLPAAAPQPAVPATAPPSASPITTPPPAAAPYSAPPEFSATAVAVATDAYRRPLRAASDFVITRDVIAAAPHSDAGSVLATAPGIYVSRPEGEAVGHEIYLRGFDAEHGQDIALSAGGIPINEPSHLHGQGYADLNFIPPEVIRAVRVTEGVYDPHQGDFAVAGSVDFDLGVPQAERGVRSSTSLGSFGSVRQLLLWAPRDQDDETFGVAAISRSDGFGENRGSMSGLAMGQMVLGTPSARTTLHVSAHGARANVAGVLRGDDVAAGRVGFYDSYDDPSAQAQSAFASRLQFGVHHDRVSTDGAHVALGAWILSADFALRENFTGYLERSMQMPEWVGRGDLIEQRNRDLAFGAEASYKTAPFAASDWMYGTLETGLTFRTDSIVQAQNLLEPPQNETWDQRVDAGVLGADIGTFLDLSLQFWKRLTLRGGGRADVLYYDVDDRLGNFIPRFRREMYIVGFRRSALGLALGPRGALEAKLASWLTLMVSAGRGYRSPQARQLEEGESAPYATVDSAEVGARASFGPRELLRLTAAAYRTHLSLDQAFDPGEGRLERIGPSTRQGVAVQLRSKPANWCLASLSLTWVHATLDAPPPPTAADPNPPYKPGQLLPYVPPLVLRADFALHGPLLNLFGQPLLGRAGAGVTSLGQRPLPYGEFSSAFALLDVAAHVRWRAVDFGVDITNLLGTEYAASEYSFVSDWRSSPTPSLLPARHFAAGAPRIVMFNLGLLL